MVPGCLNKSRMCIEPVGRKGSDRNSSAEALVQTSGVP